MEQVLQRFAESLGGRVYIEDVCGGRDGISGFEGFLFDSVFLFLY
jgi:hypothetical protein